MSAYTDSVAKRGGRPRGRPTLARAAAMEQFRAAVASLGLLRVVPDAEGWPIVPGRSGAIEWHDGQSLAVFTSRRRLHRPLLAIPGVHRHQRGDAELRAVFLPDPETLAAVAGIIKPRRRRVRPGAVEHLRRGRKAPPQSDFPAAA